MTVALSFKRPSRQCLRGRNRQEGTHGTWLIAALRSSGRPEAELACASQVIAGADNWPCGDHREDAVGQPTSAFLQDRWNGVVFLGLRYWRRRRWHQFSLQTLGNLEDQLILRLVEQGILSISTSSNDWPCPARVASVTAGIFRLFISLVVPMRRWLSINSF